MVRFIQRKGANVPEGSETCRVDVFELINMVCMLNTWVLWKDPCEGNLIELWHVHKIRDRGLGSGPVAVQHNDRTTRAVTDNTVERPTFRVIPAASKVNQHGVDENRFQARCTSFSNTRAPGHVRHILNGDRDGPDGLLRDMPLQWWYLETRVFCTFASPSATWSIRSRPRCR